MPSPYYMERESISMELKDMKDTVLQLGATNAAVIPVSDIRFDREFRKACESNACGMFGKSWMCPPHVGDIDELIEKAKQYKTALVFQLIGTLEDSYDFEGMMEAGQKMNDLTQAVREELVKGFPDALYLGAGGCRVCEKCTIGDNQPCRFPEKAMPSLESYGVAVSQLASACSMGYINGADTVTYFGAVLVK